MTMLILFSVCYNSPLEEGFSLFTRSERDHSFITPFPYSLTSWALLSTKMAMSDTHIDSAGLATRVKMIRGAKLWLVNISDSMPSNDGESLGWDDSGTWIAILLKPGHELYVNPISLRALCHTYALSVILHSFMRPGTRHLVLTLEDSFVVGGHFYNKSTFSSTLRSIVFEHFYGCDITNTGHLTSASILFRLVASYRRELMKDKPCLCT